VTITFTMPMVLPSVANISEHWATRAKRAKVQRRDAAWAALHAIGLKGLRFPLRVTVTRIAPRMLDSHDNLRASAKHVVDGLADALGLQSDRDTCVEWRYAQERGKPAAVRVEIGEG